MSAEEIDHLKKQLSIARNEINNLRQQMKCLSRSMSKDCEDLKQKLSCFRCEGCQKHTESNAAITEAIEAENSTSKEIQLPYIGFIRTPFAKKRAVPRQSMISPSISGYIELNPDIFNNPEHSLEGLSDFSHIWILYHFHKNNAHTKAKVAPPRLGGARVGVFSTRSPHRPSPIGLSLVELEKIEDSILYFRGADMVDGTPVLDIKPFIPRYDTPGMTVQDNMPLADNFNFSSSREEPDGEESESLGACASNCTNLTTTTAVKVPPWVVSDHSLNVVFNSNAETQMQEMNIDKQTITNVLQSDPRSVYLRTKYASQIFTFQLGAFTVICKFDDINATVTVVQVRRTANVQDEPLETRSST